MLLLPLLLVALQQAPSGAADALAQVDLGLALAFEEGATVDELRDLNLERRERNFERLVERARWDVAARSFLEATACSPETELAWTARLALRELRRPPVIDIHLAAPMVHGTGDLTLEIAAQLERELGRFLNPSLLPLGGASARPPMPPTEPAREAIAAPGTDPLAQASEEAPEGALEASEAVLERLSEQQPELARALREEISNGGIWMSGTEGAFYIARVRSAPRAQVPLERLGVTIDRVTPRGLLLHSVLPGSLAEALRLGAGDVLVELCGRRLAEPDDIGRALAARAPEDPITMRCLERGLIQRSAVWTPSAGSPAAPGSVERAAPRPGGG